MRRSSGRWFSVRAATLTLLALGMAVLSSPLYGHEPLFDSKAVARRLAAIEEKDPYRLRDVVHNGRPTLIAFIDHLCYTCLRSVGPIEQLKRNFSGRANIAVIDPSHITAAHTWVKDRYRVWFVPKFVLIDRQGEVAMEYFGSKNAGMLEAGLQDLLAR